MTSALPGSARRRTTRDRSPASPSLRLSGQESTAEKISIASLQDLRKRGSLRCRAKAWNWFLDRTVGYGYRLYRPFLALLVLGLFGALLYCLGERAGLIYSTNGLDAPACRPGYPCFNPFVYSFQLLIPGLDLRQATYWLPNSGSHPWGLLLMLYTWLMIILGWMLATAIIAGITQLFRRR